MQDQQMTDKKRSQGVKCGNDIYVPYYLVSYFPVLHLLPSQSQMYNDDEEISRNAERLGILDSSNQVGWRMFKLELNETR